MRKLLYPAVLLVALFCQLPSAAGQKDTSLQQTRTLKGVKPAKAASNNLRKARNTRAVIIGIADYQNKAIPDLKYADRDAEAFARFLRTDAGGSVPAQQINLLVNERATTGRIVAAFDWLMAETNPGDKVIIYFNGHSDVELKTQLQLGFLLTWDAPARNYMAGAYPLYYLQAVVSTLTNEKKANLLLITDVCHPGQLAGSAIGGTVITATNLTQLFGQECRILSCQPDEFSLEGEQWGGGRSVFSYHLVNGLYGLADRNGDGVVNLLEIGRYLEDKVSAETAPHSQVPMILGNKSTTWSTVDTSITRQKSKQQSTPIAALKPIETRGLEAAMLARLDSLIQIDYFAFKDLLDAGRLLPKDQADTSCADFYYRRLSAIPAIDQFQGFIRRNYAAVLQDEVQQVLNALLDMDVNELKLSRKAKRAKYQPYSAYLSRAAELLGEQHYLYRTLQARRLFFEGYLLSLANRNHHPEHGSKVLAVLQEALHWEDRLPHVYWMMSKVQAYNFSQADSAHYYAEKAIDLSPSWILPLTDLGQAISRRFAQYDQAEKVLERAGQIAPNSTVVWKKLGTVYFEQGKYPEAEKLFLKIVENTPDSVHIPMIYNNLGALYSAVGKHRKAEKTLQATVAWDSTLTHPWYNLGCLYEKTGRTADAIRVFKRIIGIDQMYIKAHLQLAGIHYKAGDVQTAGSDYKRILTISPNFPEAYLGLALIAASQNQEASAAEHLKKALQHGWKVPTGWEQESQLVPFLSYPACTELLKKNVSKK